MKYGPIVLVLVVAFGGLAFSFSQGNDTVGEVTWMQRYANYGECPTHCYDRELKLTCLIWPGTAPAGGYCGGKPEFGLVAKCSCPIIEDLGSPYSRWLPEKPAGWP